MSILANSKFTYFNVAGKGDATRLALAYGGIPFTDNRIAFPDWAALYAIRPAAHPPARRRHGHLAAARDPPPGRQGDGSLPH